MNVVPQEPLAVLRCGDWRFAVPLAGIEKVASAALPIALPAQEGRPSHALRLGNDVLPVVFAANLLGRAEVVLKPEDKVVSVRAQGKRLVLWVDAVEDIVPFVALPEAVAPAELGTWVATLCAGETTLPVLNLDALVEFGVAR
jgi:hypothetical protein